MLVSLRFRLFWVASDGVLHSGTNSIADYLHYNAHFLFGRGLVKQLLRVRDRSKNHCKMCVYYYVAFCISCILADLAEEYINLKDSICDGDDRTRRSWKPNVQEKRLFSYIMDRHIRVKVTTHALRCIDKAGGIDEYLLKTPYHKMDTEMGLFWKTKIEKLYEELGEMEVVFFTPEEEAKLEQDFKDMKLAQRATRRELRRQLYGGSGKQKQIEKGSANAQETAEEAAAFFREGYPNEDANEFLVANS